MDTKKKTILVVDDEETSLSITRMHLKAAGFEVEVSPSGVDALGRIESMMPDLVLLDVMMPEKNGFAVCREIRDNPQTKKIPVIIVTALRVQADSEDAMASGANGYLTKPVSRQMLLDKIQPYVGRPIR